MRPAVALFNYCSAILIVASLISCSGNYNNQLEHALKFSGENRKQLEEVLTHYETVGDSLKLKAAVFLITSMPRYYGYSGWNIDSLIKLNDSAIETSKMAGMIARNIRLFTAGPHLKIFDSHIITSSFLINHIDHSLAVWRSRPWHKYYSFEDFCQYVLPYRVDDEPLEAWRQAYYNKYQKVLDSLYKGTDVIEAAKTIADYLKKEGFIRIEDINHPHFGAQYLLDHHFGICSDACDVGIYVMRSLGIPVAIDKYHLSPCYLSRHFWNSLIDTNGKAVPFIFNEMEISRSIVDGRRRGKVYRQTFGAVKPKLGIPESDTSIPFLFRNTYLKDVTDNYFDRDTVSININQSLQKYVYLSVFNGTGWEPIDVALTHGNRADFFNVEKNLIYQPVFYINGQTEPAGFPFILEGASPCYLNPDTKNLQDGNLYRKYPLFTWIKKSFGNAAGVRMELSADETFKKAVNEMTVADTPERACNVLNVKRPGPYRYLKYSAPPDKIIELAELHAFDKNGHELPAAITGVQKLNELRQSILKLINDNNPLSFYMSENKGEQLLFDFGKPVELTKINFYPRNDDNFIWPGDTYELFYNAGPKGWISLGRQVALTDSLYFKNIPANSLLLLHDHSQGREEEVFIYKNNKQVFAYNF